MFNIQDVRLEDTRAYREIAEKQTLGVKSSFLLEILTSHLGSLPEILNARIATMSLEQLSDLGKSMFNLGSIADLERWLDENL